ncbi:hypothetical protein A3C23_04350 [Candidatus Roizmanbacteria bacterium RIFCSPHIGHO2_02_FULL_37_13b]|uniref:Transcobalamin-like C-terminal domain-containing protein n=1 Tax=Candidatus Roizmanbacteria bacterium RIFCSPLOWO2_02_FULL_36_11 TaxID=1802071 RepID=A0A1F7JH42_9BACT|nr:MAG: hypothetical protein A3C23_04350 [Candidatus Roizmanbacteria bacterium RIFCSPHIGHO2_02_FULL_37_13b]OGK54940.1 MAG: hypothetical protein A3H78_00495 [Candidatus Roizmanbacteria bacterium RIFCSPLOWO2_02_FULL_36_11]
MKNKLLIFIIGLFILGILVFTYKPPIQKSSETVKTETKKTISIAQTVILSSAEKISNTLTMNENQTALEALKSKTVVQTKGEGENAYVTTINNVEASESKKQYWVFYVNGKPSMVGAGSYKLKNGDNIEWKIATY